MKQGTLKKVVGYPRIKVLRGFPSSTPIVDDKCLLGIEIELEGVNKGYIPNTWKIAEDGSLKDKGAEFISIPIPLGILEVELQRLISGIKEYKITKRCSVHVHLNVQDLTEEELYKLIILYIIFEKSLFKISGEREDNNFCIPLYSFPNIVSRYIYKEAGGKKWYKYSALNLSTILGDENEGCSKYGTVEFRHHKGCLDRKKIMQWCNVIVSLKKASIDIPMSEVESLLLHMNTTSTYINLTERVFTMWRGCILECKTFKEDVESGITLAKGLFMSPKTRTIKPFSSFKKEV